MQTLLLRARWLAAGLACALAVLAPAALRAAEPAAPGLIDVKVTGTGGVPILLLPGLATPASIWDDTVAALSKENTCYAVNIAGFGATPPAPRREHFLADVRDAVIDYARAHRLDHPLIVGHSVGGILALDIAARVPDLPGRLVVVDSLPYVAGLNPALKTPADIDAFARQLADSLSKVTPEQFTAGQKTFLSITVTSPEKAAALLPQTACSDQATVGQAMREFVATDHRPELVAILCPVLILGAIADKGRPNRARPAMSIDQVEQNYRDQYANLAQARFQFFPQSRHFIMVDDPAGFQAAIQSEVAEARADRQRPKSR